MIEEKTAAQLQLNFGDTLRKFYVMKADETRRHFDMFSCYKQLMLLRIATREITMSLSQLCIAISNAKFCIMTPFSIKELSLIASRLKENEEELSASHFAELVVMFNSNFGHG